MKIGVVNDALEVGGWRRVRDSNPREYWELLDQGRLRFPAQFKVGFLQPLSHPSSRQIATWLEQSRRATKFQGLTSRQRSSA